MENQIKFMMPKAIYHSIKIYKIPVANKNNVNND